MLSKTCKLVTALLIATYATAGAYASDNKVKKEEKPSVENVSHLRIEAIPSTVTNYPMSSLDWVESSGGLGLSGVAPKKSVHFSIRKDELITDSTLSLFYTPSPSLIPVRSQLNIYLNGLLVKTLPIEKGDLGNKTEKEIALDPRALGDDNIIEFEFIGHYTDVCENPVDSTLWLNIGAASNLKLTKQKLHIANDLANFPVPFFNVTTNDKTVLPVVFATIPDESTIKAASIVSSFGGVLTKWRGIDYPVFINSLPDDGNAVVFITNDNRPYFLQDYPKTDVPAVEMADIPSTLTGKMLIVSAPDSEGLVTAAKALAMGNVLFNGPLSRILEYREIEKRKPYDAPNWIDTSKKVTFGSLATFDGQLSSQGFKPIPISLELNLPPDLYFVNGSRIDMNLLYKYSKPSPLGMSQLRFLVNDHLLRSYPLKPENESDVITENMPLLGTLNLFTKSKVETSFLKPMNRFTFDFNYSMVYTSKVNECTTQLPIPNRVEIDPSSTIDFSGLYHFTLMPNLELFWKSGYPFSVYADLQETAAVIENPADTSDLCALFNTLGRIGAQLGYSSTNIEIVTDASDKAKDRLTYKDILVVGKVPDYLKTDENATLVLNKTRQAISTSFNNQMPNSFSSEKRDVTQKMTAQSSEGLGAIVSFRSPLNKDRTVIAILSDSPSGMEIVNKNIILNSASGDARGSITLFKEDRSRSFDVGESYYVGDLPWYQRVYYVLLDNPWMLMLLSLFSSIVFCIICYKVLRRIQKARLLRKTQKKAQ